MYVFMYVLNFYKLFCLHRNNTKFPSSRNSTFLSEAFVIPTLVFPLLRKNHKYTELQRKLKSLNIIVNQTNSGTQIILTSKTTQQIFSFYSPKSFFMLQIRGHFISFSFHLIGFLLCEILCVHKEQNLNTNQIDNLGQSVVSVLI